MKERGILFPIFSLPSKYGIGDFGYEAYEFIDILSKNGIEYWEILPINACNGVPYSTTSYYALYEYYISLDKLKEEGLIKEIQTRPQIDRVIYDDFREKYYKEAYSNFQKNEEYEKFIKCQEIKEYAEFMSSNHEETQEYFLFLQYILYKQWIELRNYANSKNVKIIGDLPIYPIAKSSETKFHPEYYEIKDGKVTFEAGTPPDEFNSKGQNWGSPVYNIENIKKDNYTYFIKRFKYHLKLFDKIRIDHFIGFDRFYKIPAGKPTTEGYYAKGVSYDFFDELFKDPNIKVDDLIVEDLGGKLKDSTIRLREYYGFTRQKPIQIAIDLDKYYDSDNSGGNVLVFPANHDFHTVLGWYQSLSDKYKEHLKEFLRRNDCEDDDISHAVIKYCMKSNARMVIVTVQDILSLGDECRINVPGVVSPLNWSWKLIDFNEFKEKIKCFKE